MKTIIVSLALLIGSATAQAAEQCSRYCNPEVSKPCGQACIPLANACRKSWSTACSGERPAKAKGKSYSTDEVKHVDEVPTNGK